MKLSISMKRAASLVRIEFEELTAVLRQRFGIARVVYHRKPSASKPAAPEVIQELAQTCDYVIVAIGS